MVDAYNKHVLASVAEIHFFLLERDPVAMNRIPQEVANSGITSELDSILEPTVTVLVILHDRDIFQG